LYSIARVDWKVFGSLTWRTIARRRPNAQHKRERDFRHLVLLAAKALKLSPRQFHYYHALEFGAAGECHFHFLIAKAGLEKVTDATLADCLERIWSKEFRLDMSLRCGAGKAIVKPFNDACHLEGVAYLCKREYDDKGQVRDRCDRMSEGLPGLIHGARQNNLFNPFTDSKDPNDPLS
jgi:hypothetical protein